MVNSNNINKSPHNASMLNIKHPNTNNSDKTIPKPIENITNVSMSSHVSKSSTLKERTKSHAMSHAKSHSITDSNEIDDSSAGPKVFDLDGGSVGSNECMNTEEQEDTKWKDVYGAVHEYLKKSKYVNNL